MAFGVGFSNFRCSAKCQIHLLNLLLKGAATSNNGNSCFKGHLSIGDTGKSGKRLPKSHGGFVKKTQYFNGRSIFSVSQPIEGNLITINVSFTIDGELFWEEIKWDHSMPMPYDKMLFHNIKRKNNQMLLGYTVCENAVQVLLEVSFLSKYGSLG
ncbi:hypothetical protein L1049_017606 [Liquidambar formosana]|uniref:Uncharacterized protein n=1 Tax=Liquidambar formosana TaxID=63359 RepID=A0AAP0S071_LIQFO